MSRAQLLQSLWGEHRGKVLLLLLLILLIGGLQLWLVFWIEPQIETSRVQLRNSRAVLQQARQRQVVGGGAEISGLADDLEHFYKIMPPRSGLGSFIGRLYSYAADAGIDIDQITYVAKPVEGTELLGYRLSFDVSGSYSQLKKFILRLENSPSLLILRQIALGEARQEQQEVVRLQMQLQTFFRWEVQ